MRNDRQIRNNPITKLVVVVLVVVVNVVTLAP